MMFTTILTPTGTEFEFKIDKQRDYLVIRTQNSNEHCYKLSSLRDLYVWLKVDKKSDWVFLGSKGEEETPNSDTVEEWARSQSNPVNGFYGVTSGRKGRFASYVPSVLEYFGFVQITHNAKNNSVKAI